MARRSYATPQQYADWLGVDTAPAGAERALAEASLVVDEVLLTAVYDVDDAGMPTAAKVVEALTEATCAQADYGKTTGDPNNTGAAGAWSSVKVGSASLTRGGGGGAGGAAGGGRYAPQALAILWKAGLIGGGPYTGGC